MVFNFGATQQSTGLSFGSTVSAAQPSATAAAPIFGSSGSSLFGSANAPSSAAVPNFSWPTTTSTPSLGFSLGVSTTPVFGSGATTTVAAPLFAPLTASKTAPSLFGSGASNVPAPAAFSFSGAAQPTGSLFGSNLGASLFGAASSAPLFGSSTISSTAPLFGSSAMGTSTTPSLFGGSGLFGAKPATQSGGLFTSLGTQPSANAQSITTLQDVIQNSEALVRSLTSPELYGDERDPLIAKLNQLQAACGIGQGYYKADQEPINYKADGPFHLFKAVVYNRNSEYSEADGIVALILSIPFEQLSPSGMKQKLIDAVNVILGNNIAVRAHLESVRQLPGSFTEVLFYATEKGKGRIKSTELYNYLKQPAQEMQLKSQLFCTNMVPRAKIEGTALKNYLENPPTGLDPQIWQQSVNDNPNSERLIPCVIRGFEELRARQELQASEVDNQNRAIEALRSRVNEVGNSIIDGQNELSFCLQRQKQLSYRILRCLALQYLIQRYSVSMDEHEEKLETKLEAISACISGPNQLKSYSRHLMQKFLDNRETLKLNSSSGATLSKSFMEKVGRYFNRCQDAFEKIVAIIEADKRDLQIVLQRVH